MAQKPGKDAKRIVNVFALASFLNDLGSDMIYPVWPLFVTSLAGVDMAVLGLIDGVGDALVSVSQAASGYVSDRIRRRKVFIWLGYFFGAASRVGYALSVAWQHLLPFRILDRAGKMRGAPRDAMIADASTRQDRGRNFGFLRALDNLGAVVGVTLSILFFQQVGYNTFFMLAAIPSLVAVGLVYFFIKEKKPNKIHLYKGISFRDLGSDFKLFLVLSAIFALGAFSYSFLLIYAKNLGFQLAFIPVLYLIFTVFAALFSLPFGKLADKIGRKAVMFAGLALWALVCYAFLASKEPVIIIFAFVLYGLHRAAIEPVQKAFVSELAPEKFRASSLGGFQLAIGLCAFPSSLVAGLLWEKVGTTAPLYLSLALTTLAAVLLFFVKEK